MVLPGVGAFGACARALRESGLEKVARAAIAADVPFLAVCIGFQLLYEGSDEDAQADDRASGIFPGRVTALPPRSNTPRCSGTSSSRIGAGRGQARPRRPASLRGLGPRPWVYFVHSFAPPVGPETVAVCDYGGPVAALVERGKPVGGPVPPREVGAQRPGAAGELRRPRGVMAA